MCFEILFNSYFWYWFKSARSDWTCIAFGLCYVFTHVKHNVKRHIYLKDVKCICSRFMRHSNPAHQQTAQRMKSPYCKSNTGQWADEKFVRDCNVIH